ncbi:GNAT family N-acetyltransferase [Caballeronia concitans]|uniref:FR47 domain-containing protein n=1 Tax=Caballeronia concitans TaxID=1777133 RepID=A0A658R2J9_9BURK|nr:GNAT family N-acetyltransferase [Caballeronia concitans]KIG01392.1 FR47 domain protein [Burkholderia sp. MR1]SAL43258.1 FR47 domain-containing protein [Caballeronia concitans]
MKRIDADRLDNPAWEALTTKQARIAEGDGLARRFHPSIAPFAGVERLTEEALERLAKLLAPGESVLLQTLTDVPSTATAAGLRAEKIFDVLQMTDERAIEPGDTSDVHRLSAADAEDMVALAVRTNPGPFARRTIETGQYIGVRDKGRLIAMAGERMRPEGFVEISAVCVDDDFRGKGIAARLMNILRADIRERGDVPFLHVRADNATAIGLYRRLGFEERRTFALYRMTRV